MIRICVRIAAIVLALTPVGALAQERAGDAALGALSGAVVLGPVGAVAGAVVGYTAGPAISHSWRAHRSARYRAGRAPRRTATAAPQQTVTPPGTATQTVAAQSIPPAARAPAAGKGRSAMPPVQALE